MAESLWTFIPQTMEQAACFYFSHRTGKRVCGHLPYPDTVHCAGIIEVCPGCFEGTLQVH